MQTLNYFLQKRMQVGAIALTLTAAFLGACNGYEEPVAEEPASPDVAVEESVEEPAEVAEAYNVQLGELTGNVEDYLGQTVSVRGEAEAAIGESAFLLQDDQLFGGEEVIVFNASGEPFLLPEDEPTDEVQVTGEVRELVFAEFEEEFGIDLEDDLYVEYEDRPAIVAQSIAFAPDPEEISEDPEAYYGRTIAVTGEIGEVLAGNTFTIQEEQLLGGEEVLVVGLMPELALDENEEVVITGTLRPYVSADFDRDYDLTWDLDFQEQIEAEYTEEPVLVADEVYPSAQ
ncbi:MAG: hypothetical protein VKK04_25285 [Synechococcales bacterium]|nr:hypothetical protein [Synechococcales bacterium]